MVIVPATANIIAKISHGIADDMLSSTFLAATCKKLICPAMNTHMFENIATQENLKKCKEYGINILEPASGRLACGDSGKGKLPDVQTIADHIDALMQENDLLKGKKILVTAGPTQEMIDPVRYITNHSSGKMGYAIAEVAKSMGADVTLMSGPVALPKPNDVTFYSFTSANDLFNLVKEHLEEYDYIIKAAAVGDYRIENPSVHKIKKGEETLTLNFVKNPDILAYIGEHKQPHQVVCGFAMETENLLENSRKKLAKKHLDMVVANSLRVQGAGFGGDTNVVTIITDNEEVSLGKMSKEETASHILDKILELRTDI